MSERQPLISSTEEIDNSSTYNATNDPTSPEEYTTLSDHISSNRNSIVLDESQILPNTTNLHLPSADEEEFIQKYGAINVNYITPPSQTNSWFTKPYALNYFHKGILYRTKNERSSDKLELFLDLIYVGIVSNLASQAVNEASWESLIKFIIVFIPAWNIWCDLKEFMNSYFNDDLLQKIFVLWIVILLIIYDNNCLTSDHTAFKTCVLTYIIARLSYAIILIFYSTYIMEHRIQMRLFASSIFITSSLWILLFTIKSIKIGYCFFVLILEQIFWILSIHPWTKKKLNLIYSTAVNIEHEDERFQSFFIIALGEFVFGILNGNPLKTGLNSKLSKGISVLIISFLFLGFYTMKDGSIKAIHALRRSATTATTYMYAHLILIGALLITGDSAVDLAKLSTKHVPKHDWNVLIFYNTGISISLLTLTLLACLDKETEYIGSCSLHSKYGRWGRLGPRIPLAIWIFISSWMYEILTLNSIMWINTGLLSMGLTYEFCIANPLKLDFFSF